MLGWLAAWLLGCLGCFGCLVALLALIVTSGISLLIGQGLKFVIDAGFGQNSLELLNQSLVILIVLAVVMAAATFTRFYLVSWLGERVSADIRTDVFNHLIRLHPSFFETNRSGEITSRLPLTRLYCKPLSVAQYRWH